MSSVNKVVLVGRVGNDPEIRSTSSGSQFANFSLATSETWKDKNSGEKKERTEWHRVSVTNQAIAKVVADWVKKGSLLYLEGQLQTSKWQDKEGNDRYTTEVNIAPYSGVMKLLGGKPPGESSAPAQQAQSHDLDDEIPF